MNRISLDWVDQYIVGTCSSEERAAVERWLAESLQHRILVDTLRMSDERGEPLQGEDATWERVRHRALNGDHCNIVVDVSDLPTDVADSTVRHLSLGSTVSAYEKPARSAWKGLRGLGGQALRGAPWSTALGIAISALLIVGAWRGVKHYKRPLSVRAVTTYMTRNGQRAEIRLPDGSTVALNVASRLDVPTDYAAGNHTVALTGEAIFTVHHDGETPFMVVTDDGVTRVLGTTFLIRHYAADSATTVAVRDGKVAVQSMVLAAQQQVQVGRHGHGRVQPVDPTQFTFITGELTFHMVPLRDAVAELDRWYDADVQIADSAVANDRIDGAFAEGSLADLASLLELTFNIHVVRNGRVLTLYPGTEYDAKAGQMLCARSGSGIGTTLGGMAQESLHSAVCFSCLQMAGAQVTYNTIFTPSTASGIQEQDRH